MKLIALCVMTALLVAADSATYDFGQNETRILCVPKQDLDQSLIPYTAVSTNLKTGTGHTPGFAVLFNVAYVQSVMPGYEVNTGFPASNLANQFWSEIDFVAAADRTRYGPGMRGAFIEEIWSRRPPCETAQIRPIASTGYYRAQCNPGDDNVLLLDQRPTPDASMPDVNRIVIASCRENLIKFGPYKGAVDRTCIRSVIIGGFLATYHFQEQNADPQFDAFIRGKIAEWKRSCR